MKLLKGGCRVFQLEDFPYVREGTRTFRRPISRETGAQHVAQTVSDYAPGRSPARVNPSSEEVLYCVSGHGSCSIAGNTYPLEPGSALYVPAARSYAIDNPGPGAIRIVAVCCPEDEGSRVVSGSMPMADGNDAARLLVHEQEREPQRSGDRQFKLLVDKDLGCERVTQFVGFIPPSKAPFHFHPYEEAIYILEGSGTVHSPEESCEYGPGTSIFLPIGCSHCLENTGPGPVRLLGVFYPSGSPAVSYASKK